MMMMIIIIIIIVIIIIAIIIIINASLKFKQKITGQKGNNVTKYFEIMEPLKYLILGNPCNAATQL